MRWSMPQALILGQHGALPALRRAIFIARSPGLASRSCSSRRHSDPSFLRGRGRGMSGCTPECELGFRPRRRIDLAPARTVLDQAGNRPRSRLHESSGVTDRPDVPPTVVVIPNARMTQMVEGVSDRAYAEFLRVCTSAALDRGFRVAALAHEPADRAFTAQLAAEFGRRVSLPRTGLVSHSG